MERARFFAHNRRLLIGEKKKIYEKTGVKLCAEESDPCGMIAERKIIFR